MNYEEAKTFDVDIIAREHANQDSFPFRYGMYESNNWTLKLFDCSMFEWQIFQKKFFVKASFYGKDNIKESGCFIIWLNGYKNPKVGTVWREDKDSEMLLSQYLRSAREDERLNPNDLLELHELFVTGRANTLDKLARILYDREKEPIRKKELQEAIITAEKNVEYEMHKLRKEKDAEVVRMKSIAHRAVDGLQDAEKIIKNQSGEIENLNANFSVLGEKLDKEIKVRSEVEKQRDEALEKIKVISQQHPQYDGSDVEISTVGILLGVELRQRTKANGQTVDCVFLSFEGNIPERKMDEIFDPQNLIYNKAKNLIGKKVVTTTWKPEIFKATHWFRDIFLWDSEMPEEQSYLKPKIELNNNVEIYLNCPFSEKDQCKALGGKWDNDVRKWYVPTGLNPEDFVKWLPKG